LLLLLHHQLVISDGGSREVQSVKNRPRAATAAAVKAKGREAHPAGGLSAIPRSRNTREKKEVKKKKITGGLFSLLHLATPETVLLQTHSELQ
jgi:hypothetical protein